MYQGSAVCWASAEAARRALPALGWPGVAAAAASSADDCRGVKPPERKERHIGYASTCKIIDKAVVMAVRHVVQVLHADDLRNRLSLRQLIRTDVAQTEVANQALRLSSASTVSGSSIDPSDGPMFPPTRRLTTSSAVQSEISQIIVDGIDQFLTRKRMNPRFVLCPPGTYFGDDHQSIRIGMKRLLDDPVGHVRTVKIARIDVIDPGRHCLSQNGYRCVNIARRSVHLWTGKLHGAIAHSLQTD